MAQQSNSKSAASVTVRDVASRALVSLGTVSRVFNNYPNVEADLRLRVLSAASELGYVPRSRAGFNGRQSVETEVTHIAFCCRAGLGPGTPIPQNPYFSVVLHGVQAECRRQKLHLLYQVLDDDAGEITEACQSLVNSGADALLLVNFTERELVRGLLELGMPTVLVDHYFPDLPLDVVMNENYAGVSRAMQHLIEMGHRRIGFVDGLPHYTIQRRREAYRAILEQAGLPYRPEYILPANLTMESGVQAAEEIVRRKLDCTAFFCANDSSAIGLVQGLTQAGRRVPEDISVVGFDDIEAAGLISPPLTTVRANADQLGRMAVRRLMERVSEPTLPITQTLLHSSLIERQSVRRLA